MFKAKIMARGKKMEVMNLQKIESKLSLFKKKQRKQRDTFKYLCYL